MSANFAPVVAPEPVHVSSDSSKGGRVELVDVSLGFGQGARRVEVLQNVSLTIDAGEFVSIVGPSGCGKSTLLNIIAGFSKVNSGRVALDARVIVGPGSERGVVFQHYSLFPWLTVLGNVEFGLHARGLDKQLSRESALKLLARCGLAAFTDYYPEQLSGGMRQRVGIVRALATEPRVLLLDEPFGALDAQTRELMQELLLDIWQRFQPSLLFITHDIEEAAFLSDRVYVMSARPGRIAAELEVPLPRPRTREKLESGAGRAFVNELRALVRQNSNQA